MLIKLRNSEVIVNIAIATPAYAEKVEDGPSKYRYTATFFTPSGLFTVTINKEDFECYIEDSQSEEGQEKYIYSNYK